MMTTNLEIHHIRSCSCIRFQVPVFGGSRQRVRHGERPRQRQKDSEKVEPHLAGRPRRHSGRARQSRQKVLPREKSNRKQEQIDELAADPQPLGPMCPRRGWEAMDMVDLQAEFRCRVRCLQAIPSFLRGQSGHNFGGHEGGLATEVTMPRSAALGNSSG